MDRAEPTSTSASAPRDRVALILAGAFVVLAVLVGLRTGYRTMDVDQQVYRATLADMRDGTGYYPAMRQALVEKEGVGPSNARAYRIPTLFLALSVVPQGAERLVVAIPFAVIVVAAWWIGRPYGAWGGTISVGLCGFWVVAAAPLLYLHAEIWGAAALLGGLALARRHPDRAAVALGLAVAIRELFAPAFLVGLLLNRRRPVWWVVAGALGVLAAVHLHLASGYLDPRGYQPPLRFSGELLQAIGPGDQAIGALVGIVGGLLGLAGCILAVRAGDDAARIALLQNVGLAILTVTSGRTYWGYTFGLSTAVFAAVAVDRVVGRLRSAATTSPAPVDAQPDRSVTAGPEALVAHR